jgi:ABC-type nickel/cobalt efflux system permease component RcnA
VTLFSFAGAAIVLGWAIPEILAQPLEAAVGIMLVGLGAHVLWRLWRDRVHFHRHRDAAQHVRTHSHAGGRIPYGGAEDEHEHGFRWRSLAVGLMHGMAGSAALLVLAISQVPDPMQGVAYVVLFGLGSMIGMGALSIVIAVPFVISARLLEGLNYGLQAAVGLVTIGIGTRTIYTILGHANV